MELDISIRWHGIIDVSERPISIVERSKLLRELNATIPVGTAPDGLPLVMRVSRSASIVEPVLHALHANDISQLSPEVRQLLGALNKRVQDERRDLGIAPRGPLRDCPHYISMTSVPVLFGDTLLARLLGTSSPLLLPEDRFSLGGGNADRDMRTCAGVLMSAAERVRIESDLRRTQHLAVPLDEGTPCIVRQHKASALDVTDGRPLIVEDLRRMRSATFYTVHRIDGENCVRHFQGEIGNTEAYRDALRDAYSVGWTVSRADLIRVVAEVARSLVPLHRAGKVHCDIKPANILITKDGAIAHDSLDVKIGALSAAGTKGWNAPEQIVARPVSPATDIFALAQLVVQILEAAVFGDERSFVVPVGRGQRIRERMLVEPDVYLDPNLVALDDAAIAAWRSFLRKCLAFDSEKRIQSANEFADDLLTIAEMHRVPGRRSLHGLAGKLTRASTSDGIADRLLRLSERERGGVSVMWLLEDSYSMVHRTPWQFIFGMAA